MMPTGETFDFLFSSLRTDRSWPHPLQLRIIHGANALFFKFGFDAVSQLAHTEPLPSCNDSFFKSTAKKAELSARTFGTASQRGTLF